MASIPLFYNMIIPKQPATRQSAGNAGRAYLAFARNGNIRWESPQANHSRELELKLATFTAAKHYLHQGGQEF
jgi:hypothetical protein